jgi:hypothetical protein
MLFTISVSPSLSQQNLEMLNSIPLIKRLTKISSRISEINFTYHIPPFVRDAHGVFISEEIMQLHLKQLIFLQDKTGILISPVFNNIYTSNSKETLDEFIKNLYPLYDLGIRSITVPHLLWMKIGTIRKIFPDLKIKNTVLRRVRNAQDFWSNAEAGYDYINIDRILIRDYKTLKEIRHAQLKFKEQTGKYVYTSLLTGEGCPGICPLIEEHHQHTLTFPGDMSDFNKNTAVFRYPQYFSCLSTTDVSYSSLISVNLPVFNEDLNEICGYFDIIKLPGRRAFQSLGDCLSTIERFSSTNEKNIFEPSEIMQYFIDRPDIYKELLLHWRKQVKKCRFQCWNCNECSDLFSYYINR